ncbi:MAG: hypothetical protein H7A33_04625 [Deltaproteobacteria bacterium]|nr:hypothetical protein [Deltaproteobacteria bacterium]
MKSLVVIFLLTLLAATPSWSATTTVVNLTDQRWRVRSALSLWKQIMPGQSLKLEINKHSNQVFVQNPRRHNQTICETKLIDRQNLLLLQTENHPLLKCVKRADPLPKEF